MRSIGKAIIAAVLATFTFNAFADGLRLTTGKRGLSYYAQGQATANLLRDAMGVEGTTVMDSKGAWQNMDRLRKGEADIGWTQGDNAADYLKKHAGAFDVIGLLGEECIFIAGLEDGKVEDEDDLQSKGPKVAVGNHGTGSMVSWRYMGELEKGYKNAGVVFKPATSSLGAMLSNTGTVDAVMWVQNKLTMDITMFKALEQNKDRITLVDVNDKDLNDTLPNGQEVYVFRDIKTPVGDVEVPCTPMLIVARPGISEEHREAITTLVLSYASSITGG